MYLYIHTNPHETLKKDDTGPMVGVLTYKMGMYVPPYVKSGVNIPSMSEYFRRYSLKPLYVREVERGTEVERSDS